MTSEQTGFDSDSDLDPTVSTGIALCTVLAELLDEELGYLLARDASALEQMLPLKQQVVDDIRAIEPQLAERLLELERGMTDPALLRLRQLMISCRDNNRRNRGAAATGLRVNQRTLQTLRSILMLEDLSLYDASGELNTVREKRDLGKL